VRSCLDDFADRRIDVELSGVTFMDVSGLTVLVDTARWADRDGGAL
jgi:anti-anti-sigma regulatory factor